MDDLRHLPEDTVEQVEAKRKRFAAWANDPRRWATKVACDLYTSAFLLPKVGGVPASANIVTIPTTAHVRTRLVGGSLYGPLEATAIDASEYARAFHWPLAFPEVMIARGGFDVVLGNPPWERIKLQEQEFFATRAPEIAQAPNAAARRRLITKLKDAAPGTREHALYSEFEIAKRTAEASSALARVSGDDGGRFPLTGRGDLNTYALFAEHARNAKRKRGRFGLVLPSGVLTDAQLATYINALVSAGDLRAAYTFSNASNYFPGTTTEMFTLLTAGAGEGPSSVISYVENPEQINEKVRSIKLEPSLVSLVNPNTLTMPLFRTEADAALVSHLYRVAGTFVVEADRFDSNPWNASFPGFFHMANESQLFFDEGQIGEKPKYSGMGLEAFTDDGRRWLPLYEGKMMSQYDH
jgi:hypothetical protein